MRPRLPDQAARVLMLALALSAALVLGGCASLAGNARYEYTRTVHADGSVTVAVVADSGRNLAKGFSGRVGADGALDINVGAATQGESALSAIGELVLTSLLSRGLQLPAATTAPTAIEVPPKQAAPGESQ